MIPSPPAAPSQAPSPAPHVKAIALVGPSHSGKTELICRLLEWFAAQGLKAAVLKHSHHRHLGEEGKDTWRYRQAGGQLVALAAPGLLQITRSYPEDPPLPAILAELAPAADLILVEGYKTSDLPKLGLVPPEPAPASLPDYPRLVAWVSSQRLSTHLPVFHPHQVRAIGNFILDLLGCR